MVKFIRIKRFRIFVAISFLGFSQDIVSQVLAFDRMEQLYDQGHYRMVYRRALRYLNNPVFDYSIVPKYYHSLTALQRIQSVSFRRRKSEELQASFEFISQLTLTVKGREIVRTHYNELEGLQLDLSAWLQSEIEKGSSEVVQQYEGFVKRCFVKLIVTSDQSTAWKASNSEELKPQETMIAFAETLKGTSYLWGGMTKDGFDCSGFTCFVFKEFGIDLPRVSTHQYENSIKVSAEEARIGDLVFFGNEGKVTHVGILVNQPGEPKKMIHASSSKGVVFQSIDNSKYFSSHLIGFGRY